jgi:lsr operon transcriptional repressor
MAKRVPPSVDDVVLRAAWLYYREDLTQDQIAKVLDVSRATVGRLLDRARSEGVVRVEIDSDVLGMMDVARALSDRYEGVEILVVPSDGTTESQQVINERLARAAAQLLRSRLRSGDRLAIGWGDTIARTLAQLPPDVEVDEILSLTGGVGTYLGSLAETYGTRLTVVPAPFLASTASLAAAFAREEVIDRILRKAVAAPWKLVGIGGLTEDASIVRFGYQSSAELEELRRAGAVGDVLGQFLDAGGKVLDLEVHRRRIGVELNDLDAAPGTVIAVAGGAHKRTAIAAALRHGHIGCLVTTEEDARSLLSTDATHDDATTRKDARDA